MLTNAPADRVGKYVKIWFTTGALSATVGPVLGGLLVLASWRWLFLINLPIVALALVLTARYVPNSLHEQDERFPDVLGGLVLIIGVGALALGLVEGPDWGWSSARVITSLAVSVLALALFIWRSSRHPAPVIQLSLFRDRIFSAANSSALLAYGSFSIMLLSSILWLQGHWHYSAIQTGLATAPAPIAFAAFAAVGDTLQGKFHIRPGRIAAIGLIIAAVGTGLLAVLITNDPHYVSNFLPAWILMGIGFGLALPTTISSATVDLRDEEAATGSAIVSMSVQIGTVVGVSTLVAILGAEAGAARLSDYGHAWTVAGAIAFVCAFTVLAISAKRSASS